MKTLLNKLTVIIMCLIILLSSININAFAENLDVFAELFSDICSLFEVPASKNNTTYENKTLILTSSQKEFDTYGAYQVDSYNNIYILRYKTEKETKNAFDKLKKQNDIVSVEIDATMEIQEATNQNTEETNSKTEQSIAQETDLAKYISGISVEPSEVKVAILDTGIDTENELFSNRIIDLGINLSTSGDENSIQDDNGHGTDIATIIASNSNEKVKLMPIKVANAEGKATIFNTYQGIQKAIENGANIINISMNTIASTKSQILTDIINQATEKGIVVVVSAGNNGINVENITPANIDSAIVVSAINNDNTLASYSNYGETIDYCSYGTYEGKSGTSYANASVAGIVADLLSKDEDISVLGRYAVDFSEEGYDRYLGNGFIGLKINAKDQENGTYTDKDKLTVLEMPDFKTLTDEEINTYVDNSEPYEIGIFLSKLSEVDYEKIISRDTNISGEITLYDLEEGIDDETGEEIILTTNPTTMYYYEFCLSEYEEYLKALSTSATYSTNTGYYTLGIKSYEDNYNSTKGSVRVNIKLNSLDANSSQTLTPSDSSGDGKIWLSNKEGNYLNISIYGASTKHAENMEENNHTMIYVRYNVTVPAYCYLGSGGKKTDNGEGGTETDYGRMNFNIFDDSATSNDSIGESCFSKYGLNVPKSESWISDRLYTQVNVHQLGIKYGDTDPAGTIHNTIYLQVRRPSNSVTLNKGTGISSVTGNGSYYYGESVTINATPSTGYSWSKWSGTHDTTTKQYTFTMPNDNVKDKANATPNEATIQYHANGGKAKTPYTLNNNIVLDENGNIKTRTIAYNNSANIDLINVTTMLTREGYHVDEGTAWAINSPSGSTISQKDGEGDTSEIRELIKEGNKTVTLYANWQPNTYTVNYDGNGATGGSTTPSYHTYNATNNLQTNGFERKYIVSYNGNGGSTPNEQVSTYTFNKWTRNANGTGGSYTNGQQNVGNLTDVQNGTVTLYAQWNSASITLPTPTRTGYIFAGWYDAADGGNKIGDAGASYTPTANITLYAHWTPIQYTVVYNPNNPNSNAQVTGTMANSIYTYDVGEYLRANTYARNAYTFINWNTAANGSGTTRDNGAYVSNWSSTNGEVINLYAQWRLNLKNITGSVSWSDQENKYASRPANVQVTLHHDTDSIAIQKEPDQNPLTVAGNSNYTFTNTQSQKESNNQNYTYTVTQNVVPGYQTTINGYNITNTLITPTYTSSIGYTPIDTFENRLLKNGKIKITAQATTTAGSDVRAGMHNGIATFTIDSGVTIDTSKIKISFYDASTGQTKTITNYTLANNVITVKFGADSNGISEKGDKITIEIEGMLNKIGNYSSNIAVTGKLRDVNVNSLTEAQRDTNINLGQVTSATSNFIVEYQMPQANIKITKHDSITEQNLTDATFTLYEWNGTSYVEKEILTDSNKDGIYESNYYEWNVTTQGKYKVVETSIPQNHKDLNFSMEYTINQLKTANYTIMPDYDNANYKITYGARNPDDFDRINGIVENEPYKIKARIELLDSETRKQIVNPATFRIYEWDNTTGNYKIYTSYTTGSEVEMKRLEDGTYLVGEWLYYTTTNEGKYRIIEETAPTGYYGDYDEAGQKRTYDINVLTLTGANGQSNEMTITLTNDTNGNFTNQRTKTEIKLNKIDSQTKGAAQVDATLEGAVYEVYAKEDIHHSDGTTTNYIGETALLYKAGQLVTTKTTDAEGKITFDNLECGKYYIKEKTPSEGYLLDKEQHDIDVTYQGQDIAIVKQEQTYEETVKKQSFQIYKIKQTDRTEYEGLQSSGFTIYQISNLSIVKEGKISKNTDGTYTLNDSVAKQDESITKLANKNGTYNIIDLVDYYYKIKYTEGNMEQLPQNENSYFPYNIQEEKVKDYSSSTQGSYIEELISNGDGYIRSPELAYGEYIVIETTVPKNLETAKPFYINIQEDLRTPQKLKFIVDADFETKVKIYKKDIDTGKNILQNNVKYVIYNEEGELQTIKTWDATNGYVEYGTLEHPFTTGTGGYLITPMQLPVGKYTLKELEAPNGYVLNGYEGYTQNGQLISNGKGEVTFEISTTGIYYTDDYLDSSVIVVNQQNEAQVGTLKMTAKGEYVKQAQIQEDGNYNFTYETRPIQGVTFEIRAKENILTQDGHNTIIYNKDQVVKTITTNQDGIAYAENLPLGNYYIKETVAGSGFALNEEQKEFTISYGTNDANLTVGTAEWKDSSQKTPVINLEEEYTNQRQELKITVNKTDGETNEPIQGTLIGLYAKQDIVNQADGQQILAKDTLVLKQETNEQGQIIFENNLPLENYYIKEIKATQGYVKNNNIESIDGTYDTAQQKVKEITASLINYKTYVNIQKTDTLGQALAGATIELRDNSDETIQSWTTEENAKNIKGLKVNQEYKIVETAPATGYVTAQNITFTISEQGEIQTNAQTKADNTIIMQDENTKIKVELLDIKTREQVVGAVLKIINANGEEVSKWTTDGTAKQIEKLSIGHYTLVEESAPTDQGYVKVNSIEFDIRDTAEVQKIEMLQERTKLQIEVQDKDSSEQIEGAMFQIIKITKETDEQGNEQESQEVVQEFTTTNMPYYIEKLPTGKYILKELETPTDKGYVTIQDKEFEIIDTLEVQKVIIEHDVTRLQVNLLDKETNEKIIGATLQIINKETNEIVREFTTKEEPYYTEKLPTGKYILKQTSALTEQGQVTTSAIEFTIIDTREIQEVTMLQDYTKLEVEVTDKETGEKIQGAKFQIIRITKEQDSEGNEQTKEEIVREFTTGEENYQTTRLAVGQYILRQEKEQKEVLLEEGYATLQDIRFEITDTAEVQKVEVHQDHTKLEVEVTDIETGEKIQEAKLQIIRITKQIDENGNEQTKEEIVREFTTEAENYKTTRLAVGQYILRQEKEQTAALLEKGYATLQDISFEVKDTAEVQKVEVHQDYTKLEVEVTDKETGEKIQGVKFQIIRTTKETDENGNEQTKEKIVREFTTGEENYQTTRLAVGQYILRQEKEQKEALLEKGYATLDDIDFEIKDTAEVQKVEAHQDYTKLEVEVTDIETSEKIQGAKFQIIRTTKETDENGNEQTMEKIIREFTTGEENYQTTRLAVGQYILRQEKEQKEALLEKGYATLQDISFEIKDTAEVQKVEAHQDHTKLEVEVTDKETGEKIQGAKFQIIRITKEQDSEGNEQTKEEIVREFTTGEENYQTTKLAVGQYILRQEKEQKETLLEKGYVTQDDIAFEIADTAEWQKVEARQDFTKLQISLIDKDTNKQIEGATLQIVRIVKETNEEGQEEKEELIEEWITGNNLHYLERLAVGNYRLKEIKALQEQGDVTTTYIEFEIKDNKELQTVEMIQSVTKLQISLLDKDTKEQIEGVKLQITKQVEEQDSEGNVQTKEEVIEEWITGNNPHYLERLPIGNYTLKQAEIIQDNGQVTTTPIEFKITDTEEIQAVEMIQSVTKLEIELQDIATKALIEGAKFQILQITDSNQEKIIEEWTTDAQNHIIERLPIGSYVLRQLEDNIIDRGYVKLEDLKFNLIDTEKTQKIIRKQDYTKLEVNIVDKETKEAVIGATLEIQDEEGNTILEQWISNGTPRYIERLPVGKYMLVQKEAPGLRGYVKSDPVEFEIKGTKELQTIEMQEDYTKTTVTIIDPVTKEPIKGITAIVKDKNGNKITEIKDQDGSYTLEKLPTGTYILETQEVPYGYKNIQEQIKIEQTKEGKIEITAERENFDIQVETWVQEIVRNGKNEYTNTNQEQKLRKLDIKDKNIKTEDIKITYTIRVKNVGKITGQVGKVISNLPAGMEFRAEDNKTYWKVEDGKIITTGLAGRDLKEGAYADLQIVLRWKNGLENFGTKVNAVKITEITSDIGFTETNQDNNSAVSSEVIIGVSTGEMNLVWACWILLVALILIEVVITKKLKIKKFKIKDKTLKYRNNTENKK